MTKKQELEKERERNGKLLAMVNDARERVRGYEQLAKVHSAYIAILLQRLGAAEDNAFNIKANEIADALENLETRALAMEDGSWSLYVVRNGGGTDGDVSEESATIEGAETDQ